VSDIFQEVEEDVRRERYEKLWKQYGNYIIAGAVLLVLAVAGYQFWRTYDLRQRQAYSDRFQAAQQLSASGNLAAAETQYAELANNAPAGYATLAQFHLAGVYLEEGKRDQSVALLQKLTTNSDPVLASTARLRLAWIMADAEPKAQIATVLQPLLAPDSAWRFAAQEVLAYVDLRTGARTDAETAYTKLSQDTTAPQTLRQRALAISAFLKANPDASLTAPPPPTLPSVNSAAPPNAPAAAPATASPAAQGSKPK
jgi:hypothetical protein